MSLSFTALAGVVIAHDGPRSFKLEDHQVEQLLSILDEAGSGAAVTYNKLADADEAAKRQRCSCNPTFKAAKTEWVAVPEIVR